MNYSIGIFRFDKILLFMIMLITVTFVSGCDVIKFSEFPVDAVKDKAVLLEGGDIAVYAELIYDVSVSKEYFGTNPLSKNILPVFVYINNTSQDRTFLVEGDSFSLKDISRLSLSAPKEDPVANTLITIAVLAAPVPTLIIAGKPLADDGFIKDNYLKKQFTRKTITHGRDAYGFVYFHFSKDENLPEQVALEVTAMDINSLEKVNYHVTIYSKEPQK